MAALLCCRPNALALGWVVMENPGIMVSAIWLLRAGFIVFSLSSLMAPRAHSRGATHPPFMASSAARVTCLMCFHSRLLVGC